MVDRGFNVARAFKKGCRTDNSGIQRTRSTTDHTQRILRNVFQKPEYMLKQLYRELKHSFF